MFRRVVVAILTLSGIEVYPVVQVVEDHTRVIQFALHREVDVFADEALPLFDAGQRVAAVLYLVRSHLDGGDVVEPCDLSQRPFDVAFARFGVVSLWELVEHQAPLLHVQILSVLSCEFGRPLAQRQASRRLRLVVPLAVSLVLVLPLTRAADIAVHGLELLVAGRELLELLLQHIDEHLAVVVIEREDREETVDLDGLVVDLFVGEQVLQIAVFVDDVEVKV